MPTVSTNPPAAPAPVVPAKGTRAYYESQGYGYVSSMPTVFAHQRKYGSNSVVQMNGSWYLRPTYNAKRTASTAATPAASTPATNGIATPATTSASTATTTTPTAATATGASTTPTATTATPTTTAAEGSRAWYNEEGKNAGYILIRRPEDVNDAVRKYGASRVKRIGGNMYVVPEGLTAPTATTPIPGDALGATDPYKILAENGINVTPEMLSPRMATILAAQFSDSPAQNTVDTLTGNLNTLVDQLGGKSADYEAAKDKYQVDENFQNFQEASLEAQQLRAKIDEFDNQTDQISSDLDEQAIPTGLIQGQQGQLLKQRTLIRNGMVAEYNATVGLMQVYQGNVELGRNLALDSVNMKYDTIETQINATLSQIGVAQNALEREDGLRANVISAALEEYRTEIAEERENETAIMSIAIEAAGNGAPLSVVNAVRNSADPISATVAAQGYVGGSYAQRTKGGGGGGGAGDPSSKYVNVTTSSYDETGDVEQLTPVITLADPNNVPEEYQTDEYVVKDGTVYKKEVGAGKPGGMNFYGKNAKTGKTEPIGAATYARKKGIPLDVVLKNSTNPSDQELILKIQEARSRGATEEEILQAISDSGNYEHLFVGW